MNFIGEGRGRRVYLSNSELSVVKIPISEAGIFMNWAEDIRWKKSKERNLLARCRLIPNSSILVMERVEVFQGHYLHLPDWCWGVDCFQVGYTRAGKLVAYDYGG